MANLSQMSELYLDCPELQHLSLEGNSLSALDLSNCTKLVMLNFSGNNISHMNLQCPDLDLLVTKVLIQYMYLIIRIE